MNKKEARARIEAIKAELVSLEEIVNTPEPRPVLLPEVDGTFYQLCASPQGGIHVGAQSGRTEVSGPNAFCDHLTAKNYAKAFETFLLLRQQPGTVPASSETQAIIRAFSPPGQNPGIYLHVIRSGGFGLKSCDLSPCFETVEDAEAAIEAVGEERILQMCKTFHHID